MKYLSPALITGASGFVGSHLAEELVRRKVRVKLLVRKTSRLPFAPAPEMELCYGDVTDLDSVLKSARGVKVIYHLAGILRGSDHGHLKAVNAEGTRNVCEAAKRVKGLKRLLYVSSLSAAGPARDKEEIDEKDPCRPVSFYGKTKLMGEEIALAYRDQFPVTVLRPGAVYGPRETDIFAYFKMVRQGLLAVPRLTQKVSFIHVLDLVEAMVQAADSPKAAGQTYFVSDGKAYTWEEFSDYVAKALKRSYLTFKVPMGVVKMVAVLGEVVEKLTGKATMLNLDKVKEAPFRSWVCSSRKIRRDLGFKPQFEIQRGIENAVEFYRSAGWLKP